MSQLRIGSRPGQAKTVLAINLPVPDFGATYISDTDTVTPTSPKTFWAQLTCIADGTIALTGNWDGDAASAVAMKAGTTIYGIFTKLKAASGAFVAYYGTD